jgi:AcrR family transcriptional regulator
MSRADSKERTRALLVRSAGKVFAKRGYNAATVEQISEAAGFSRGAFYANFDDKADLFLTILEEERERDFEDLAAEVAAAERTGDILSALHRWFTRVLVSGPLQRATAEFRLAACDHARHRRRLAKNARAVRTASAGLIAQYCERHELELTVEPEIFATMVIAAVGGFADQLRLDPGSIQPDTIGLTLVALWNGVTKPTNGRVP